MLLWLFFVFFGDVTTTGGVEGGFGGGLVGINFSFDMLLLVLLRRCAMDTEDCDPLRGGDCGVSRTVLGETMFWK